MKTSTTNYTILEAQSEEHFQIGATLFREYAEAIQVDLCFQNFEKELQELHLQYVRPTGCLFLVRSEDEQYLGCAAIRKIDPSVAELKRMYVRPQARGMGLGLRLLQKAVEVAEELAYEKIRLDTMPFMESAIRMYEKMGFYQINSYRHNPHEGVRYYEKSL